MKNTYQETLQFLFSQLPMYQRNGKAAFKKTLDNINALVEILGSPQVDFQSVHVAGTNGKGSVSHLLAAYYIEKGYRVGIYTSPHYKDFRERIKINNECISEEAVVEFVEKYKEEVKEIRPSFFEWTVALAFKYFADQKVDIAIIETGLGGRLDSTNIIKPLVSVITNIGYDHQAMLGDTLPEIASEKAGIIKEEVPVVIGERQAEVEDVFVGKAKEMKAPLAFAQDFSRVNEVESDSVLKSKYKIEIVDTKEVIEIESSMVGPFQINNICTALKAVSMIEETLESSLDLKRFKKALENIKESTYYIGRWEILGQNPLVIADSAHNKDGLKHVFSKLQKVDYDMLHLVIGVVNDKDLASILPLFPSKAQYYFVKPNVPRGLDANELKAACKAYGFDGVAYESVNEGLSAAKEKAGPKDVIFVGASTFTVAEVL